MEIREIEIGALVEHEDNSNVMSDEMVAKLKGHIEKSGNYEPLVVREHPKKAGCFQLINGHHRYRVLGDLGYERVDCVVWDLDDGQTLELLATVNRLSGDDDPMKRGKLLEKLAAKIDQKKLLAVLPETKARLEKMLSLGKEVEIVKSEQLAVQLMPMTFFVDAEQKEVIDEAMKVLRKGKRGISRGGVLVMMAEVVKVRS